MHLQQEIKSGNRPFVIAGPCSAESPEQLLTTCQQLVQSTAIKVLRAGIWKPRTRPGAFEGRGEEALPWLIETGKICKLPTATEVANASQTEAALKAGIDVLWIGARTTVNPFLVQEIADALKGTKVPIMIKNPVNPDLELWVGAFERFLQNGLEDLTAIHRGFSLYKHPIYRNVPMWEIPIALRERIPNIPILCDPSHISGKRSLVSPVSQTAMDLNFEGLMIETHFDPNIALSDAAQQLTPENLILLLENLVLRGQSNTKAQGPLLQIRQEIEQLDDLIFEYLKQRLLLSQKVGEIKLEHHITVFQQKHWETLINDRLSQSSSALMSQEFVRKIMDAIHQESIQLQIEVMQKGK
jgi:chorismate mutase